MLRLAAQAPSRSGPVTSTLGSTSQVAPVQAQSHPSLHSRSSCRTLVRPRLTPFPPFTTLRATAVRQRKAVGRGRYAPALLRCGPSHRKVSPGGRFAPACCAAQSVHGRAACAVPFQLGQRRAGVAMGQRPGKATAAASSSSALASPRSIGRLFVCQLRQARPEFTFEVQHPSERPAPGQAF